jgi:tetratricopeptide (TPR) repeat protein
VLKAGEGSLDDVPFALLLHAIDAEERSCTLELKLRNLEKHVFFEEGQLVGCESNLLHESLGKYLVSRGKLTEAQHHTLASESAATAQPLPAILVEQKLVSPFELFKHLQASIAHRILDAFRWQGAKWKLGPVREVEAPIRMNCARLIFMGSAVMPDEALARHFPLPASQQLAHTVGASNELKLTGRDLKLFNAIKPRPTVAALRTLPGFTPAEVSQRLFAWCVLGLIDLAECVDASSVASSPSAVQPAPSAPAPAPPLPTPGLPYLDDDEDTLDALASNSLTFRSKDPFDLLGVPVTVESAALQRAFLARAERFPPARFRSAESRSKAELLLVAYARAFGALADPDQAALHRKRRETAAALKKAGGPRPDTAAKTFRIQTELLDAGAQFTQGLARLEAGDHRSAAELFEYACDIEPKGRYRAYLLLARYRLAPETTWQRTLLELAELCQTEPACEEAWGFRGDLAMAWNRRDEAREAWERAAKLNPGNPRYARSLAGLRPPR